jgi:hypothetical protein
MFTNKELFAGLFFSLTVIFSGFCMFSIFISFYHCLVGGPFQHLLSYKCVLNVKCFKITNVGLLFHVTVSLICIALSLTYKYIYSYVHNTLRFYYIYVHNTLSLIYKSMKT